MATTTKKRPKKRVGSNKRSGPPRRKAMASTKPSANGKGKVGGDRGHSPKQKLVAGMEDDDDRIPEVIAECEKAIAGEEKRKLGKKEKDAALGALGPLLHKHDLRLYKHKGKKFYLKPGVETVAMAVLDQGQG